MGAIALSRPQLDKKQALKWVCLALACFALFVFFTRTAHASGGLIDPSEAMGKGKELFEVVAKVLGTFLIIIGGIVAVYGLYTVGVAIKDGVSGQMPQSLSLIIGGVLMAVAGFIMKSSATTLFQDS